MSLNIQGMFGNLTNKMHIKQIAPVKTGGNIEVGQVNRKANPFNYNAFESLNGEITPTYAQQDSHYTNGLGYAKHTMWAMA